MVVFMIAIHFFVSSFLSLDQCDSLPCKNNGICSSLDDGLFVCECTPEYQGETCEGTIYM